MGDRVWVQLLCWTFISICYQPSGSTQPGHPSWIGAMSISLRALMPCGWGVKAGMVRVWVAGKTMWPPCYTRAIYERFRDNALIYKALYKFICLIFYLFNLNPNPNHDIRFNAILINANIIALTLILSLNLFITARVEAFTRCGAKSEESQ